MRITIVVDANIIMSALLGGKPSIILFDSRFDFAASVFTLREVKKYFPRLAKKTDLPQKELLSLLNTLPLKVYEKNFYRDKIKAAERIVGHIDKKDVEILALVLKLESYLWSEDKHFEKSGYPRLLKTHSFL